jgi:hypothetical protein
MRELARQLVKNGAIMMPKEGEEGALDFGLDEEEHEDMDADGEGVVQQPLTSTHVTTEGGEEADDEERKAVANAVLVSIQKVKTETDKTQPLIQLFLASLPLPIQRAQS